MQNDPIKSKYSAIPSSSTGYVPPLPKVIPADNAELLENQPLEAIAVQSPKVRSTADLNISKKIIAAKTLKVLSAVTFIALVIAVIGLRSNSEHSSSNSAAPNLPGATSNLQSGLDLASLKINRDTIIAGGKSFTASGPVAIQNEANSDHALSVQDASGKSLLIVDTKNNRVGIGQKPAGDAQLQVAGNISTGGSFVSTLGGFSLGPEGLSFGSTLVCSANGCISSSSPAPTPQFPTIDVANVAYLNKNQTFSGSLTFSGSINASDGIETTGIKVNGVTGTDISCAPNEYIKNPTVSGGVIVSGTCNPGPGVAVASIQEVYNASSPATFTLNSTNGLFGIRDALSPLATNLFEVTDNSGSNKYFAVSSAGVSVLGNVNSTGQYQVNGTQISSANLSNDSNLAKLNGSQIFTGANTFSNASNSFTGNGSGLTNVNASTLNGQSGSYYTNASNIASGTLSDSRLSSNVALLNTNQTFTGNNTFSGTVLAKNSVDSTAAFQIQNAAGTSNLLTADTTNTRLAIGQAAANYTLDVAGDINSTTGIRVGGTLICSSSGCLAASGSGSYIQNGTSSQTANFNIQSNSAGSVTGVLEGASGQTADILDVQGFGGGTKYLAVGTTGIAVSGNVNTTGQYQVNGAQIASSDLSDGGNLAKLDGTQTFTGANTFSNASNSFSGDGSGLTSLNASNVSSGTLSDARLSNNVALLNANQTFSGGNTFTGSLLSKNSTDSTSAFQIQNAAGTSNLFIADTTNSRIAIGQASANYPLDVAGDINSTTGIRVGGTLICSSGGCLAASGSGSYVQNGTTTQTANFNIRSNAAGSVAGVVEGASGQSVDIFDVQGFGGGTKYLAVGTSGVTVSGNVNATGQYQLNGTQISSSALSNDSNLAKLDATQTFTGANTFSNASNSFTGNGSGLTSLNATNVSSGTLNDARLSSNVALLNTNQTFTGSNTFTGTFLAKNSVDSSAAFQIQNAAGTSNLFIADTSNSRVAINQATAAYSLDVVGDINSTTGLRVAGTLLCTTSGCTPSSGSGYYIQNGTTVQTGNFFIQSANANNVGAIVQGAASQTADILQVKSSTTAHNDLRISSTGEAYFQNSNDSTTAFQVQNAAARNLFNVDTTGNSIISLGGAFGDGTNGGTTVQIYSTSSSDRAQFNQRGGHTTLQFVDTTGTAEGALQSFGPDSIRLCTGSGGCSSGSILNLGNSSSYFRTGADSTTAFQIQNAAGTSNLFIADTSNSRIAIAQASANYTLDVAGDINTTGVYRVNGSQISSANLSNDSNLAKLDATQTFTGNNTFKPTTDSTEAFSIQNSAGNRIFNVNSTDGYVINNGISALVNQLTNPGFEAPGTSGISGWNLSNGASISNDPVNAHSGNYEMVLPAGVTASTPIMTSKLYAVNPGDQINAQVWVKSATGTNGSSSVGITWYDSNKVAQSTDLQNFAAPGTTYVLKQLTATVPANRYYISMGMGYTTTSTAGTWYFDDAYFVDNTSRSYAIYKNSIDSSTSFQIQNAAGTSNLFIADTSNSRIAIAQASANYTLDVAGDINTTGVYRVNGSQISSANLSNDSNLAKLDATQTFTGNNTFTGTVLAKNTADSTTAFQIQNAGGTNLFNVDTTNTAITLAANTTVGAGYSLTIAGGNTASRPASPTAGTLYYDTTSNQLLQYNGGKWVSAPRSSTLFIAASNSTQAEKDAADVVVSGTDDAVAINTAMGTTGGINVYLMEGTYNLGSTAIAVPNNTTLSGAGAGTILKFANNVGSGTYYAIKNYDGTTGTHVNIQNLMIDGNKTNQSAGTFHGIYFNGMGSGTTRDGGKISGVVAENLKGDGFYILTSANNIISGNTSKNNTGNGIRIFTSSNNTVTGNINQGDLNGIVISTSSNNNTVTGNLTQGNTSSVGIYIYSSSNGNTVTGNTSQGNSVGIYLNTISNNTVSGNTAQANSGYGIYATGGSNNTIGNNKVYDNGGSTGNEGIYLDTSSINNSITGNDITDSSCTTTCYAIDISDAGSTGNYLASNHFLGDGTHAASINDATTGGNTYSNQPLTENGDASFRNATNSTTAFQIQGASSTALFTADTVNSKVTVRGANSNASLGSELVTSQDFTNATYWSNCNAGATGWTATVTSAAHNTGNTAACSATASNFAVTAGATYLISYQLAGNSTQTETVQVSMGGKSVPGIGQAGTNTQTAVITATSTSALTFTPTTNFNGTISSISVKQISLAGNPIVINNDTGTPGIEIRTGGGTNSTFVGLNAGQANSSSGSQNSAFGSGALQSNMNGQNNSAFGAFSLQNNTTGNYNTGIGSYALQNNTTGANNSALGYQALASNTVGSNNIAVGYRALQANLVGSGNIALGSQALSGNLTGNNNTALGNSSLILNTTGNQNTATGSGSLSNNTTGSDNSAYGVSALNANTTGGSNSAMGNFSLNKNTTGTQNAGSGFYSLNKNTTGSYNAAFGAQSLGQSTTGNDNTALGYLSLYSNTTGSNNTALGYYAGFQDPSVSAFATSANLQKATMVGYGAEAQSSNVLILGGAGANAVNVGIGTTSPSNLFSVSPDIYDTGTASVASGTTAVTGSGTSWTSSMAGMELIFADGAKYTIASVGGATSLTLSSNATTTETNSAYRIHNPAFYVSSTGSASIRTSTNSAQAFQVQDSSAQGLLTVDTTARSASGGNLIKIGNSTGTDIDTTVLVLDSTTANPTSNLSALNGGLFYNSTTNKVSIVENGAVKELCNKTDQSCGGNSTTLQQAYDASTSPQITLDSSPGAGGLVVSDNATPLGTSLFTVQNSGGTSKYLDVSASGVSVAGNMNVTGQYRVGGTQISSANLSNDSNLAKLNGTQTFTGVNTFKNSSTTAFQVQNGTGTSYFNVDTTNGAIQSPRVTGTTGSISIGGGSGGANTTFWNCCGDVSNAFQFQNTAATTIFGIDTSNKRLYTGLADGASTIGFALNTPSYVTSGAKLLSVQNNAVEKFSVDKDGNVNIASGAQYRVNGSQISSSNLSDSSNLAKLDATQTFTGNNTFTGTMLSKNTSDSTAAFQVQDASGSSVVNIDTSNHALDIQALYDTVPMSAEMMTNSTSFGAAAGWSITGTGQSAQATHTSGGGTTAVSPSPAITIQVGHQYQLIFSITSQTTGNLSVEFGGVYCSNYGGGPYTNERCSGTATSTAALTFTPSSDSSAVITGVSFKEIISAATSTLTLKNSDGTSAVEIRTGGTGNNNTFIGLNSGENTVSGSSNTALGVRTLQYNTTGQSNAALGGDSLRHNTTGNSNTAVGEGSLNNNTTGSYNVALGNGALQASNGSYNSAVGSLALGSLTSGFYNTSLGSNSLNKITTGSYNTAIGYYAGFNDSTFHFSTSSNIQKATMVGYGAEAQASNVLILGGAGADAVNVGIGTTSPTNLFSVSPDIYDTGTASVASGTTAVAGSGTSWTSNMAGMEFIFGDGTKYTIASVSSSTSLTLTSNATTSEASAYYRIHNPAFYVSASGSTGIRTSTNSTTAFQVQNSGGNSLLNVDTTNSSISLNASIPNLTAWKTNANSMTGATLNHNGTVTARGYIYSMGGNDGAVYYNTVKYAKLNADGSTGAWSTTTALPRNLEDMSPVYANGYIYIFGGVGDSTTYRQEVYFASVNADGTLSSWTQTANLPVLNGMASSVYAPNGYIYIIGGYNSSTSVQNTIYYAKPNADGTISSWTTNSINLPAALRYTGSAAANGYIYVTGGENGTTAQTSVFYGAYNPTTGAIASWTTSANPLTGNARYAHSLVAQNNYLYVIGGTDGSASKDTILYASLGASGANSTWTTDTQHLPAIRNYFGTSPVVNGYIYVLGGSDGTSRYNTVYYSSTPRLQVGGNLDLVGASGGANSSLGTSSGGHLTAGNTNITGTLQVQGSTTLNNGLAVVGNLSVQSPSGTLLMAVDTANTTITLGRASATPVLLVLGNKNTPGDPTCTSGAIYYNSNAGQFRGCAGGNWTNLGDNEDTVRAYNSSNISVLTSNPTVLTFDSERFDTNNLHSTSTSTSRLTAAVAGKYMITASVEFSSSGTGTRVVQLKYNNTSYIAMQREAGIAGDPADLTVSTVFQLNAGDYVEVVVSQNSGSTLTVNAAGSYSPEFSMTRIAD